MRVLNWKIKRLNNNLKLLKVPNLLRKNYNKIKWKKLY